MGTLLAAAVVLLAGPGLVHAASCNGASHQVSLSGGRVDPGSGGSGTTFLFSVTYRDTGNCAPSGVRVRITGIGTFSMAGSSTDYDGGVRFTRTVRLTPVGSHPYLFLASSGSGNGEKHAQLTNVRPRTATVEAPKPTPKPTPRPTPKPTPRPTVAQTRPPNPSASAKPTKPPSASPAASVSERPRRSRQPSASPSVAGVVGPGSTQRPGGFRQPPRPRFAPAGGFDLFDAELSPTVARLVQWTALTVGGLGLLLLFSARRGGDRREPLPASRSAGFAAPPTGPSPVAGDTGIAAPPSRAMPQRRDEENMPRWLRPSVRAGRQGRSLDD